LKDRNAFARAFGKPEQATLKKEEKKAPGAQANAITLSTDTITALGEAIGNQLNKLVVA